MNYIEEYYKTHNEDGRLMSRHGQVEYFDNYEIYQRYFVGYS